MSVATLDARKLVRYVPYTMSLFFHSSSALATFSHHATVQDLLCNAGY